MLTVAIPITWAKQLKSMAKQQRRPCTAVVRDLLSDYLKDSLPPEDLS